MTGEVGKEDSISKYRSEYSTEILKIKTHELLLLVRILYNNKRLDNTY